MSGQERLRNGDIQKLRASQTNNNSQIWQFIDLLTNIAQLFQEMGPVSTISKNSNALL